MKDIGALSNRNRILIFRSEFPILPRKISEYQRTELSSGSNTRKIRGFYKILNSNDLCLRGSFPHCKKHHFGLRNGPFQGPKQAILHPDMGFIGLRNGQYRKARSTFRTMVQGISKGCSVQNRLYNDVFNIPLHLFCEFILSK